MDNPVIDKLRLAWRRNPDASFSLFTLAGHVVTGRIMALEATVTLEAGKESAEVPVERVEAFSCRRP